MAHIQIRLPDDLHATLKEAAARNCRTIAAEIRFRLISGMQPISSPEQNLLKLLEEEQRRRARLRKSA